MDKITCGQLAAWLAKQPADKPIRFAVNGPENTQEFVDFDECFDTPAAYWVAFKEQR